MRRLIAVVVLALAGLAPAPQASGAFPPVAWCGVDQAATERADAVNGFQWHVVYAFPVDGSDRFAQLVGGIATDLAAIDAWWRSQDPARAPRFDLAAFAGCASAPFGTLDVSRVQLPQPASVYQPIEGTLDRVSTDLIAAGFTDPDKKYLVYYDGPTSDPLRCGEGLTGVSDRGGRLGYAAVYLGVCSAVVGTGETTAAITATHELIHALDALDRPTQPPGPPNACSTLGQGDDGHPCDDKTDVLYPTSTVGDTLQTRLLDSGRNDYYGHAGPWWDVQDSGWLVRLDSPDTAPPSAPKVSATSARFANGIFATVSWSAVSDPSGVTYRVYQDGDLPPLPPGAPKRRTAQIGPVRNGQIVQLGVRAADGAGLLSPLSTIRFKVGFGIVDANGRLVKDTVPPPGVPGLRGLPSSGGLTLRWNKVKDTGGPLRGYRLERNGKRFRDVPATVTSLTVPPAQARGTWSVRAIDGARNVGPVLSTLRVS